MTTEQAKMLETSLGSIVSLLNEIALRNRKLQPYAAIKTDGTAQSVPDGIKAFNIINLGLNGEAVVFDDIAVTGITGITVIPKNMKVFGYSIENDQNQITGPIQVTGTNLHHIVIQYLK